VTAVLGARELRRAAEASLEALRAHQTEIDEANVYPVPDGDTGTNLVMTMESVVRALEEAPDEASAVAHAVTAGSLMGARGNSGVILAQVLRGLCESMTDGGAAPPDVAVGLKRGADLAYEAVLNPVEGTMLTVLRAAVDAASARDGDVATMLDAASTAARDALARTPEQLPVLKQAGVVDAGGMGLLVVLESFADALAGRPPRSTPHARPPLHRPLRRTRAREMGSSEYAYEVQYMLETSDNHVPGLRESLGTIGDSVAVVGGGETWKVHVHTNDIGRAIELGIEAGRPSHLSVMAFEDQIAARPRPAEHVGGIPLARPEQAAALVSVASGPGLTKLFHELGAAFVVEGGETMNPSVAELLEGIDEAPADAVIVLPNSANVLPAAMQAAARASKRVNVLPTSDAAEGLAAAIAFGDARSLDDNIEEMASALERVRSARVTIAVRDGTTPIGEVRKGQAIAFVGKQAVAIGDDAVDVCAEVIDDLATDGAEIVTIVAGAGVNAKERERLAEFLASRFPSLAVEIHDGGQPAHRYLIAVE
jgi:fatty acid kinase